MKSLMRLLECVLEDSSIWCGTSTTRDFNTISRRVDHEGISFLTITLPVFGQDFERSLELGHVDPTGFRSFAKSAALPHLFKGLLGLVFCTSTGVLRDVPSIDAIYAIRQICYLAKKVLLPCSTERERNAFDGYVSTDESVRSFEDRLHHCWPSGPAVDRYRFESSVESIQQSFGELDSGAGFRCLSRKGQLRPGPSTLSPVQLEHFRSVSRLLWGSVLNDGSSRFHPERLVPRHGPGSTAERILGNKKYNLKQWHRRLDYSFPSELFCIPNFGYVGELGGIEYVDPEHETPVRVISVPKTLKTPRIIAVEPVCVQYTQQSLMEVLVDLLESHRLTAGRINFRDQTVNQKMALSSSKDGRLSTIDLKDASDRVSAQLVWEMLSAHPGIRRAVFDCRSLRAEVPGRGVISLSRFASMGSALCFPIEAMVFYTIILSAMTRRTGQRLTLKSLLRASESVRVYGDDIIVPVESVQDVWDELEWFNLRVNDRKTFRTGKFRESCGLDAYDGIPVTPVYCRRLLPTSRHDAAELISAVSLGNQLYQAGYWRAATYVRQHVESLAKIPHVAENSAILGWNSVCVKYEVQRWDSQLHRWLVKGLVVSAIARRDPLDGASALMKFFLKRGQKPFDEGHLERYGRPVAVHTKQRWGQPY